MCIIVYKPAGIGLPSKEILKECWDTNPMGAGFAVSGEGVVEAHKGYMKFKPLYRHLKSIVSDEVAAVIHFRIGTSGKSDKTATHPFPISDNPADLQELHYTADAVAFHNGVIHGYGDKDWSDTQEFIATEMVGLMDVLQREEIGRLIGLATGSKWAIVYPGGKVMLIRDFHEKDGIYYSNYGYVKVTHTYGGYGVWGKGKHWDFTTKSWVDDNLTLTKEEEDEEDAWEREWDRQHRGSVKDIPFWDLGNEEIVECEALGQGGECGKCQYCVDNETVGTLICALSRDAAAQLWPGGKGDTEREVEEEREAIRKAAEDIPKEPVLLSLVRGKMGARRSTTAVDDEDRKTAWGRGQWDEEEYSDLFSPSRYV